MRVVEVEIFKFDELDDEAKERARQWWRDGGLDYEWWDSTYEWFITLCRLLGVEFATRSGGGRKNWKGEPVSEPMIFFSGFYTQGSGSSFKTLYCDPFEMAEAVRKKVWIEKGEGNEETFKGIPEPPHHHHEAWLRSMGAVQVRADNPRDYYISTDWEIESWVKDRAAAVMEEYAKWGCELLEYLNDWLFSALEEEYEYLMSDEQIDETLRINEYEFTKEGEMI